MAYCEESRLLAAWSQGDALGCNVCLLLSPSEWLQLRAAHHRLWQQLPLVALQWLFQQRLRDRTRATKELGRGVLPEEDELASLAHLVALAASIDAASEVLRDIVAWPKLVSPGLDPIRKILGRLHELALRDRQLMPRERRGRRSTLPRRLVRIFAGFSGLMPDLLVLLNTFPPQQMPVDIFVAISEVLASLIHNAKDSKRTFVEMGGLEAVLIFLRAYPGDAEIQAAGLATLLALSARSVYCIRIMADSRAHEDVATALRHFPGDAKIVARATGLLANMSNVPCVCVALQECGVLALARRHVGDPHDASGQDGTNARSPFVGDFVQYLMSNLEQPS